MVTLTIVSMTLAVIAAVGYPVIVDRRRTISKNDSDELDQRKVSVYRDIKDLEFDLQTGKVSEADYQAMRADYEVQAVGVLKAQEKFKNGRQNQRREPSVSHVISGAYCPACGHPVLARDRFCGGCGQVLTQMDEEEG